MKKINCIINAIISDYRKRAESINQEGIFSRNSPRGGYVLILVLIMTTLLVSLTGEFIVDSQTTISYMKKFDSKVKAEFLSKSGIHISKYILKADKQGITGMVTGKDVDKKIDSYKDLWAMDFPPLPFDDGTIQISISDENAKINLNAFANDFTELTRYYYMAQIFFISMGLLPDFADLIHDWVDIDNTRMPYGAETPDTYSSKIPPYSAKNGEMDTVDEMLMIHGITPEIYYGLGQGNTGLETKLVDHNRGQVEFSLDMASHNNDTDSPSRDEEKTRQIGREKSRRLSDYFRVYGERDNFLHDYNKININTASYRVISALTENMTDATVTEIINRRLAEPFKSVDEIQDLFTDSEEFATLKKYITVKSYIFKITSTATVDDVTAQITAYYNRDQERFLYWSQE